MHFAFRIYFAFRIFNFEFQCVPPLTIIIFCESIMIMKETNIKKESVSNDTLSINPFCNFLL